MDQNDIVSDFTPRTGKLEWHLTYRCNLGCKACSRCSWLPRPHTPDMTIADARECMRQADYIGWRQLPGPGNGAEPPRIIIIGGEPTLHPDFMEFVKMAADWSGTYVQVFSNGFTQQSRDLLEEARLTYSASINTEGFKTASRAKPEDEAGAQLWNMETYVSPAEAGMSLKLCYCHSFVICGIGVDSTGYSPCPIGLSVSSILGVPGKTNRLADLWDVQKCYDMTRAMCSHCGYAAEYRYGPEGSYQKFMEYAKACPSYRGALVSPRWASAFQALDQSR